MEPYREKISPFDVRYPIRLFRRSSMDEYVHIHPHWHEEYEILLILKGKGTQQIGPHLLSFGEGDLLPIPCGAVHSTYTDREVENEILVITFPWDFPAPGMLHGPELLTLNRFRDGARMPAVIHGSEDPTGILSDLLLGMEREWLGGVSGWELLIRARLLEWIVQADRRWCYRDERKTSSGDSSVRDAEDSAAAAMIAAETAQGQKDRTRDALRKVFELIDDRYGQILRASEAARSACLSVSQLERLFKAHTGRGFVQYLTRYRIAKVCERLHEDKSLTEIALSCGFGSLSTFSRAFHKARGMSPSDLRRLID